MKTELFSGDEEKEKEKRIVHGPKIVRAVEVDDCWLSVVVGMRPPAPLATRERNDVNTVFFISSEIFSFDPN